ncbi:phosphate/phosphite/phosphonate ABC transporter substrate-binding protein [Effusibacillus dendaii]|uniref:Phosphonate ABC transporter substrate-binding protein n=1 Tax=Effusibacillus dendaii TaxID=2743772 RepID=A0A7I8DD08_9BACL|nr:phosphate/phosphite/phosphonate ABC transporter substrate-binding protein [Effusibacillus dendaii]BCJ87985.1 hypothetical protein skT53_29700 [Effusibacillus dendaii]
MKRKAKLSLGFIFAFLLAMVVTACGGGNNAGAPADQNKQAALQNNNSTFTFGIIPAETKIGDDVLKKLETYLTGKLGRPVKASTYPNYNGVVEALNYGKLDLAYLGPLTYVMAHNESGAQAILAKTYDGKPFYHSLIIVPADSPYNSIDDLVANAGKISFAFGDPNSTSGSLVPSMKLKELGVYKGPNDSKFKKVTFTGAHNVTAVAVASKQVDAGAIDSAYFDSMIRDGKAKREDYKIIWTSEDLFQYPFVIRKGTDNDTIAKLQDAFISLKDPDILKSFAADGFVKASDKDYDSIRKAAIADGRIKPKQ